MCPYITGYLKVKVHILFRDRLLYSVKYSMDLVMCKTKTERPITFYVITMVNGSHLN